MANSETVARGLSLIALLRQADRGYETVRVDVYFCLVPIRAYHFVGYKMATSPRLTGVSSVDSNVRRSPTSPSQAYLAQARDERRSIRLGYVRMSLTILIVAGRTGPEPQLITKPEGASHGDQADKKAPARLAAVVQTFDSWR